MANIGKCSHRGNTYALVLGTTCDYALSIAERNFLDANKNHSELARNSRETYTYRWRMVNYRNETYGRSLETSLAANRSKRFISFRFRILVLGFNFCSRTGTHAYGTIQPNHPTIQQFSILHRIITHREPIPWPIQLAVVSRAISTFWQTAAAVN